MKDTMSPDDSHALRSGFVFATEENACERYQDDILDTKRLADSILLPPRPSHLPTGPY